MGTKFAFGLLAALLGVRAQTTVTATATPSSVTFSYQIGGTIPAPQTVAVRANSGTPAFTAAIAPTTALWVTVSPEAGKLPGSLSVRVNPTSLTEGTYTATINVTVTGITTPVAIAVTLNVIAPLPTLTLSTTTVSLVAPATPPLQGTVALTTTGAPVSFTATVSGATWLTVAPTTGMVLPGGPVTLTLAADPTSLNPQAKAYTAKVNVVATGVPAANKTQTIAVSLTVNPSPPTITSLWPSTVQANAGPATLTIRGTNFYSATTVKAGTTVLAGTVLVSPTVLQAVVPATMLTAPGTINIVATNPAPGGDSTAAVLTISNAPVIQAILNGASYESGSVSPGEIVALFGTGIGPAAPVSMSTANTPGFVDTSIGGLSVTIDGRAAPLLYADANQVTVQVPYEVVPGTGKAVVVNNGTGTPAAATVSIGAQSPGIFTLDGSGAGQAAAIVYEAGGGTAGLNSASKPAHAGDIIAIYLTGEGDYLTTPTAHTGYLIPTSLTPLPQMNPLPTVTIGGTTATVDYAGPIPGSIIGLLQINAIVPTGLTAGAAPVVVTINAVQTQADVTILVK